MNPEASSSSSTDTLDNSKADDDTRSLLELEETRRFRNEHAKKSKGPVVGWRDLPKKSQLALMVCARMSEPLTMSSLRSYMFYQLKWFDPSLSDATIAWQAGLMASAFTFAQFLTGMLWGRVADSEHVGRKNVLLIGLLGTAISCIGYGFANSFYAALAFRFVGGALNGNVGVMRTMVSEMIVERKFQARAFMLLPMTGNIGQIIGPIIGGYLSEPVKSLPWLFGQGSLLGGKSGVKWMIDYPYALPNLLSAAFLIGSGFCVVLGLEETHYMLRDSQDRGIRLGRLVRRLFSKTKSSYGYMPLAVQDDPYSPSSTATPLMEMPEPGSVSRNGALKRRQTLPFSRIFTRNVVITLLARGLLAMHIGTFQNLWYVFLSTPRARKQLKKITPDFFHFGGGLAMPPSQIGLIMSMLGVMGIAIQIIAYPWMQERFGTVKCFTTSILIFPLVYLITPFLATVPSVAKPPLPSAGLMVWACILGVLGLYIIARTFAMPSATILVNNACPHPSVLSTVHGAAQSVTSGMRMLGPLVGGLLFGLGLERGVVGLAFWVLMALACFGALFGMFAKEESGHEVVLEGDDELGTATQSK